MSTQFSADLSRSRSSTNWLQRMAANLGFTNPPGARETLERAISEVDEEGEDPLSAQERTMMLNILGFGSLKVSDIMVPRADIIAISEDESIASLLKVFAEAAHSRIPVFRSNLDNPIGMVHIRDVLAWATAQAISTADHIEAQDGGGSAKLDLGCLDLGKTIGAIGVTREILFAPPSMPAVDLLSRMRTQQIHLAIVIDEFGGTDGLISIEDLVEEIVGDIADEHDTDETTPIGTEGDAFVAVGRTPIAEVEQVLDQTLAIPGVTDDVDTLGGLIFALAGFVPKRGHRVVHPHGVTFEVLEAGARRIHKVRIYKQLALPSPHGDGETKLLPAPQNSSDSDSSAVNAALPKTRAA